METEAKFSVPRLELFDRLKALARLGEYSLKHPATQTVTDVYLDTADGLLRQGRFACRLRHHHTRGTWTATVKGLGGAAEGVHQRQEFEVSVMPNARPANWPLSEARDLVTRLSLARPLIELFTIHQVRHTRQVAQGERDAAELSLDEVSSGAGSGRAPTWELEIELQAQGTLDDLRALREALAEYELQPEPLSKFEREFALLAKQPAA